MYDIFERIGNNYEMTDDATIFVMDEDEYGGTYERPWALEKYRHLNDRGETVKQGR